MRPWSFLVNVAATALKTFYRLCSVPVVPGVRRADEGAQGEEGIEATAAAAAASTTAAAAAGRGREWRTLAAETGPQEEAGLKFRRVKRHFPCFLFLVFQISDAVWLPDLSTSLACCCDFALWTL